MKTQNLIISDILNQSEKNQLKLPIYKNFLNPIIAREDQEWFSFPNKLNLFQKFKLIFRILFRPYISIFYKASQKV